MKDAEKYMKNMIDAAILILLLLTTALVLVTQAAAMNSGMITIHIITTTSDYHDPMLGQ